MIIDGLEGALDPQERDVLEAHVTQCVSCARFREDLRKIRNGLSSLPGPEPPAELAETTRALCYAAMGPSGMTKSKFIPKARSRSIPKIIWAALFALVVLTGLLIISLLPGFNAQGPLSLKTVLAITLVVQNAAMLFFMPVLIHRFRLSNNGLNAHGNDNFVP